MGALLLFGLPTLGSWLLQPILSLIDTSVVGMSASIFELAALGPGIAWCDSTAYLFNFVGVATTNLCATALAKGDTAGWRQSVSDAMAISLFFGLALGIFQVVLAPWVITLLCGTATDAVPFALDYVRIRALAAPVAIPMIVTQAAFLANRDSITPLKVRLLPLLHYYRWHHCYN
jgi:Na+-driven multidrug efflux pump